MANGFVCALEGIYKGAYVQAEINVERRKSIARLVFWKLPNSLWIPARMKCSHHGYDVFLEMGSPCSDPAGGSLIKCFPCLP